MADHADDLHAEQTEGFKVGEKKTLDEYQNLAAQARAFLAGKSNAVKERITAEKAAKEEAKKAARRRGLPVPEDDDDEEG